MWIIGDDATALHYAASDGVPETITMLLDAGVDPFATARDLFGKNSKQTALEVAAYFGKADNARAIVGYPKFATGDRELRQTVLDDASTLGHIPVGWPGSPAAKLIRGTARPGG